MSGKLVRPSLIVAFVALLVSPTLAHDSWIARGAYRGPPTGSGAVAITIAKPSRSIGCTRTASASS